MRLLAAVAAVLVAGCFGPYASDLEPQGPAPRPVVTQWLLQDGQALPVPENTTLDGTYLVTGHQGAEPNMGITQSGAIFMTSYDETIRSRDGGRSWEAVYTFDPVGSDGGTDTGDPMLWVDPVTDRVYTNHMYPALLCFATAWSEDDGDLWEENPATCTLPGVDHQKFFSAPPGPLAPAAAGLEHPTVLFQCYQRFFHPTMLGVPDPVGLPGVGGMSTHCNLSYDGGQSWPAETVSAARVPASCGGLNGHPAVAPDGTVALPLARGCDGLYVSVSLDSGLTWTVRPGPKEVGAESIDPELAFTPDGTMHAMWRGSDHITYHARSGDLGLTWEGPWRITPPDVTSTVFQALGAGDDGRIAFAYLGTHDSSEEPSYAANTTRWHLFLGVSDDADAASPTYLVRQVTGRADPVQVGCVWLYGGGHPCRNMLDFIDGAVAPDGTFHAAFTKGCLACHEDDKTSVTALATISGHPLRGAP